MGEESESRHSARLIITSCAATSSAAAGAWSSITLLGPIGIMLGGDTPILATMACSMVVSLGKLFGQNHSIAELLPLMIQLIRSLLKGTVTRGALSFIPAIGTAVNVRDIYRLQRQVGWLFYVVFQQGKDPIKEDMDVVDLMTYLDQTRPFLDAQNQLD